MRNFKQFILWDRTTKTPIDHRTRSAGSVNDKSMWLTYSDAKSLVNEKFGIGFVLTSNDPFFLIDIDKCIDDLGAYSEIATELIGIFRGAYCEISQSKRGLHIIASSKQMQHTCRNSGLGIELYTESRYVALTEDGEGDCLKDCTNALSEVIESYFRPSDAVLVDDDEWTTTPAEESRPILDDDELLAKALESFGTGRARFSELWAGGALEAYDGDTSSRDAALAQHLAFWTGNNCERIKALMLRSGCVREKWLRDDYLRRTILHAVRKQKEFYGSCNTEIFKGCVYVEAKNSVWLPEHKLIGPQSFRVLFGGRVYPLTKDGQKTTRNAWLAYTDSEAYTRTIVDDVCFDPTRKTGEISKGFINVYSPCGIIKSKGDVSLFLKHLELILPDARDRKILLSYMSACVQLPGVKFRWAPVLQGVQGNGKTTLSSCLMHAVGRDHTVFPKSDQLASRFNGWLDKKLLVCVEDIYVPGYRNRIVENLKPIIAGGEYIDIEKKGIDAKSTRIFANFIINTNYKDALRKTVDDRRFCMLYNAQQSVDDLVHDGMDSKYFNKMYSWLKNGGYNHVAEYLATYSIEDEFNPNIGASRAPITSTTQQAISESLGYVEQEILEAIGFGRYGFKEGFISSFALGKLLDELKLAHKINHNMKKGMLENLGYIHHPALKDGRLTKAVMEEGGKPRLYIKKGDTRNFGVDSDEIYKIYIKSQH